MVTAAALQRMATHAWSLETEDFLGWTLRSAEGGFTKRANSVLPETFIGKDVEEAVSKVEDWYRARGLPPTFQVFEGAAPDGLSRVLEGHGYVERDGYASHLMAASITDAASHDNVRLSSDPTLPWIKAWLRMEPGNPEDASNALLLLSSAPQQRTFAEWVEDGVVVGTAYGCVTAGWVGLFCVATDPSHRRRGIARALVAAVQSWGRRHGATQAYLQVSAHNAAAKSLYEGLGYRYVADYTYLTLGEE